MSENTWTVTGPQTIDVDGVHSLKLGIVRGRFDIVTHDEAVARIEVSEIEGDPLAVSASSTAAWRSGTSCTARRAGSRT